MASNEGVAETLVRGGEALGEAVAKLVEPTEAGNSDVDPSTPNSPLSQLEADAPSIQQNLPNTPAPVDNTPTIGVSQPADAVEVTQGDPDPSSATINVQNTGPDGSMLQTDGGNDPSPNKRERHVVRRIGRRSRRRSTRRAEDVPSGATIRSSSASAHTIWMWEPIRKTSSFPIQTRTTAPRSFPLRSKWIPRPLHPPPVHPPVPRPVRPSVRPPVQPQGRRPFKLHNRVRR